MHSSKWNYYQLVAAALERRNTYIFKPCVPHIKLCDVELYHCNMLMSVATVVTLTVWVLQDKSGEKALCLHI